MLYAPKRQVDARQGDARFLWNLVHSGAVKCQQESGSSDLGDVLSPTWHFSIMSVFREPGCGKLCKIVSSHGCSPASSRSSV